MDLFDKSKGRMKNERGFFQMFTLASPLFQVQAQVDGAHRGVFILRNVQYMAFTAPLLSEYTCPQIAEFSTYS